MLNLRDILFCMTSRCVEMWIDLESVIPSEVSQKEKNIVY